MPIPDHDIPTHHLQMVDILTAIRSRLKAKKRVYVHCRAGIGRTGTVIGCLLVEGGLAGKEALDELNRLWLQCARSQSWPYVPETDDQANYVRKWKPQLGIGRAPAKTVTAGESEPSFAPQGPAANVRQRFLGTMLGLAVADALSTATHLQQKGKFARVTDLVGGGPFGLPPGAWTDDTAMALCLAESLLACRGFDARDQVERYTRWLKEGYLSSTGQAIGATATTSRALAVAQWRRQIFAGSHDPSVADPSALSRIAPPVMFFLPFRDQALEFASDSARTTSQAPQLLETCRLMAAVVHAALTGQSKEQVLVPPWNLAEIKPRSRIKGLLEMRYRGKPPSAIRAANRAVDALEVALWAFDRTNSFAEGALQAVNVGEKSDVAGAVYGQIAGAYYGADAIPPEWLNALFKKDVIEDLALKLLAQTKVDPNS
jgi:ADP-ribosylglycohydrolase